MKVEINFINMENRELIDLLETLPVPEQTNTAHQRKLRVALMNSKVFRKTSFMKNFLKILAPLSAIAVIATLIVFLPGQSNTAKAQKSLDQAIQKLQSLPAAATSTIPTLTNSEAISILEEAKQGIDLHFETEFDASSNPEFNMYTGKITVLQYENKDGKTVQIYLTDDKQPVKKIVFGDTQVGAPPTATISENPTATDDWQTYTDNQNGFTYEYPADFEMNFKLTPEQKQTVGSYIPICEDPADYDDPANYNQVACTYYIGQSYKNTNFEAAGLSIIKKTDLSKNECLKTSFSNGQPTSPVIINGVTFYFDKNGGAGMGHYSSDKIYRTFYNNSCYIITSSVTANNANTNPDLNPKVPEFKGTDELFASMDKILSTFKFTVADNSSVDNTLPPQPVTMLTFVNNDIGVTFQYPSNRQIIFSRADGFGIGEQQKSPLGGDNRYSVSFITDNRSLEEVETTHEKYLPNDTISHITLGDEPAIMYTPDSDIIYDSTIYVEHNNQVYAISIDRTDTDIYNSFLNTFKFTK